MTSALPLADAIDRIGLVLLAERPYRVAPVPETADLGLLAFAARVWPWFRTPAHICLIADRLEAVEAGRLDRLIVVLPPDHGKSSLISQLFPAWYLGRNPRRRIIGTSHAEPLALRFSREARNLLTAPGWPYPDVRTAGDLAAVKRWDLHGERGGYVAAGVGTGLAGVHASLLICDDPFGSAAEADSPARRQAVWDWWRGTAYHRLDPAGAAVVVSTRWHHEDLVGRLLAEEEAGGDRWDVVHLPAIDDAGAALWSERWPVAALERRKRVLGSRLFSALYQGRPAAAEGGILKRRWWRFWHDPGDPRPPVWTVDERGAPVACPCLPRPPVFDDACQSWDMTFKQTASGSYVVGQVWWRVGADRYLIDQYRHRVDFPDALLAVQAMTAKHPGVTAKLVEDAANGPAVLASLRGRVPGLIAVPAAGSKESRAHAAAAAVEAGNVFLPHPSLAPWVDGFLDEAADFPFGAHDDQVDAFAQAMIRFGRDAATFGYSYLDGRTDGQTDRRADRFGNDVPLATDGRFGVWRRSDGR